MFKKIIISIIFFSLIFIPFLNTSAQEEIIDLYFFWSTGCPHCEQQKPFLEKLEKKYPLLKVHYLEVWNNQRNRQLMINFGNKLNANVSGVPFTVIEDQYVNGWLDENHTGKIIEEMVINAINIKQINNSNSNNNEPIVISPTEDINSISDINDNNNQDNLSDSNHIPEKIKAPFIGEINIKNLSLPLLTIVLGALDGFNPCAMWVLLFLISLLIGMENKKRMWILGIAFLVASASVYYIFMAAWLNLLLFIGFIVWVRIGIGVVALFGGGYNLKEYFINPEGACKITGSEKRQKIFQKLKDITQKQSFWLALGGIILLAFAVNLVELICSTGLPAVYTQILSLSNLHIWQYYAYIGLYILFFLLDDLFVFFVAMKTLQITGVTTKYSRFSHLIGGILMLIIGILLIFKPSWLMFG